MSPRDVTGAPPGPGRQPTRAATGAVGGAASGSDPRLMLAGRVDSHMSSAVVAQASGLGPLASPLGILGILVVLAAVIVVGRFLLSLAWRLVVVGIIVVGTLYVLGLLGFGLL